MNAIHRHPIAIAAAAVVVAALLGGCDRGAEQAGAGQAADDGVATAERKASGALEDSQHAANTAPDKSRDIAITAAVKAELARDAQLGALAIDVATVEGRVTLRGSAPDLLTRERATTLANAVSGVVAVDNQISLPSRS